MAASAGANQPTELRDLGNDASAGANHQPTELLEKPEPWISFGPVHEDRDVNQPAKQSAWEHVGEKSDGGGVYLRSTASVEVDIKKSYSEKVVDGLETDRDSFMEKMAKDGCYFLQLALHILGADDLLGYPQQHPYLGKVGNPSSYIPAMFFVGNQIPYVVINALMKQTFFKNVIAKGRKNDMWKRLKKEAGEDLVKLALYQVVVEPQLKRGKKRGDDPRPPPSDILRALRNLFLGSGDKDLTRHEIREFEFPASETGSGDTSSDKFPSAEMLSISGMKFEKGEAGIRNIRFKLKNFGHSAFLYLPPFTVDSHIESLLTSLLRYEKMLHENERKVTAYVSLMNDLITTEKDFNILVSSGIIQLKDQDWKTFDTSLKQIVSLHEPNFAPYFSEMRRKIREHRNKLFPRSLAALKIACGAVSLFVALFTVVQTIFAVLSYHHSPPHS